MVSVSTGRGSSKQDVQTPPDFIAAVTNRFGPISFDLAASAENTQAPQFYSIEEDSLCQDWCELSRTLPAGSVMWLNPEFSDIAPWAEKCAESAKYLPPNIKIALLVPASVGSNWYANYIHDIAHVLFLNGRLQFVGHKYPFPKDCLLALYSFLHYFASNRPTPEIWRWR